METKKKWIGSDWYEEDLYVAGAILEAGKIIAASLDKAIKDAAISISRALAYKREVS